MDIKLTHGVFSHIKLKQHSLFRASIKILPATNSLLHYSGQILQTHSLHETWNIAQSIAKYTSLLSGTCVWLAAERSPASRGLYWDVKALADAWESKTHFQCLPYDRLICMRNTVCVCNINSPMHATQTVHRRVS